MNINRLSRSRLDGCSLLEDFEMAFALQGGNLQIGHTPDFDVVESQGAHQMSDPRRLTKISATEIGQGLIEPGP